MIEDSYRGYRRVVPSPEPVQVFEQDIIRKILDLGMTVIAVGGGGIPVIEKDGYRVLGCEAVIDKDRASALLASERKADLFIISTDVEQVYIDYKKPTQQALVNTTVAEMERLYADNQFVAGSMGPKVESAIRYIRRSGSEAIITSFECLLDAVDGKTGTHVYP